MSSNMTGSHYPVSHISRLHWRLQNAVGITELQRSQQSREASAQSQKLKEETDFLVTKDTVCCCRCSNSYLHFWNNWYNSASLPHTLIMVPISFYCYFSKWAVWWKWVIINMTIICLLFPGQRVTHCKYSLTLFSMGKCFSGAVNHAVSSQVFRMCVREGGGSNLMILQLLLKCCDYI